MIVENYKGRPIELRNAQFVTKFDDGIELSSETLMGLREKIDKQLKKTFNRVDVVRWCSGTITKEAITSVVPGSNCYRGSYDYRCAGGIRHGTLYVWNDAELETLQKLCADRAALDEAIRVESERVKSVLVPLTPGMVDPTLVAKVTEQ